ncbi:unnamed protein product [Spirodela intermedia]|uniref:Uncharacterized protein n=1 Tax=Spirodela intermedia TaxID=51605 RepID=A0A7I8KSF5_SPIIN|nr:unnamed protein product [Spirodela intermedia]
MIIQGLFIYNINLCTIHQFYEKLNPSPSCVSLTPRR